MATQGQKLLTAGLILVIAETVLAMAHTGGIGVIVGLAVGATAYLVVEDVERMTGRDENSLSGDDSQEADASADQQQQPQEEL